ncbi:MAG: hypothetical protein ACRDZ4_09010 [Egibacteraceae bacterium]
MVRSWSANWRAASRSRCGERGEEFAGLLQVGFDVAAVDAQGPRGESDAFLGVALAD